MRQHKHKEKYKQLNTFIIKLFEVYIIAPSSVQCKEKWRTTAECQTVSAKYSTIPSFLIVISYTTCIFFLANRNAL